MSLSEADQIWNRAALECGGEYPRQGDAALAALLQAHGLIMNGGVHHAVECLSAEELAAAIQGYLYFGLATVGEVLQSAATGLLSPWTTETELAANKTYASLVKNDGFLDQAFQVVLRERPEEFASIIV